MEVYGVYRKESSEEQALTPAPALSIRYSVFGISVSIYGLSTEDKKVKAAGVAEDNRLRRGQSLTERTIAYATQEIIDAISKSQSVVTIITDPDPDPS